MVEKNQKLVNKKTSNFLVENNREKLKVDCKTALEEKTS